MTNRITVFCSSECDTAFFGFAGLVAPVRQAVNREVEVPRDRLKARPEPAAEERQGALGPGLPAPGRAAASTLHMSAQGWLASPARL